MTSLQLFIILMATSSAFCTEIFTKIGQGTGEDFRTPDEQANWGLVRELLSELDFFTYMTYTDILDAAFYDENTEVYYDTYETLLDSFTSALDLTQLVSDEIVNKTLTVEVAKFHLGEILVIVTDLYGTIEVEYRKLSQENYDQAVEAFTGFFLNATMYADKIYTALEEPDPASCGLVGYPANQTLITLNPVEAGTPPNSTIWTVNTFSVFEVFLMMHAHNKYLDQEMWGQTVTLRTSPEFPNFVDETDSESITRTVMFRCSDTSTVTYTFIIPVNSDPIVEPTVKPKV